MMEKKTRRHGFSLIELAVVLIIIGLLIASVTYGLSLIKKTELQNVIKEANSYIMSINTFNQKYGYYPGDFPLAGETWGTKCDPTPSNCNGNGNNAVDLTTSKNQNEAIRAWQHMGLAKILNRTYTGISSTGYIMDSSNSPISEFKNGFWGIWNSLPYDPPGTSAVGGNEGNFIELGGWFGFSGTIAKNPKDLFTPREAYLIDNKMDDGYARSGLVFGRAHALNSGNCFSSLTLTTPYNVDVPNAVCTLKFTFNTGRY